MKLKNNPFKRKKKNMGVLIKSSEIRFVESILKKINFIEKSIKNLTDDQLKNRTRVFKQRLEQGAKLDDIRAEAFAVAREATYRVLGKRPYDVQMIGGLILDLGSVAEMKTGEGKTITSIAPIYLNALEGKGVIVSTVNEYLAERDAKEMGEVFNWLGLSVGINKANASKVSKRNAYNADVTYSIHSELGFDYLRDNMVISNNEKVQRDLNFCLIDEVDSILIDEAKTPLIISGGEAQGDAIYEMADAFVRTLTPSKYDIDHETQSIFLNFEGVNYANEYFKFKNLYDIENSEMVHRIQNALRAHYIMKKDVEYVVIEDKIELVDSFTGRIMEGRAYSEGLQQAIQAKEKVTIEPETKTLATITYQNFFRMFKKLCGMTGTAKTEEQEFLDIYNMRVNVVPTNKPILRNDHPDKIYLSLSAKYKAIIETIKEVHKKGQPILLGTSQVDESEILHEFLLKENLPHKVLNAKQDKQEAIIISKAGELGSITIATNMAGRGTDIKLGEGVREVGGLFVIGTNRAEAQRIDNQLKGRAGRQGDVGESQFFLSIEDSLIKRFSLQDKWKDIFKSFEDREIEGKTIKKAFIRAQKKIEGFNYDSRKSILNYDDVIRRQRDLIYKQRNIILAKDNNLEIIKRMIKSTSKEILFLAGVLEDNGMINYHKLVDQINEIFLQEISFKFNYEDVLNLTFETIPSFFETALLEIYLLNRENAINNSSIEWVQSNEKSSIIAALDNQWKYHIDIMDKLRSSTNVVQYSQKNPYQVYAEESTLKFNEMVNIIAFNTIQELFNNINIIKDKETKVLNVGGVKVNIGKNTPKILENLIIKRIEKLLKNNVKDIRNELAQEAQEEIIFDNDYEKELFFLDSFL
ncbi:MAG: preprotein translocase subunit SecA [Metamycoplasmataceae bacterium]